MRQRTSYGFDDSPLISYEQGVLRESSKRSFGGIEDAKGCSLVVVHTSWARRMGAGNTSRRRLKERIVPSEATPQTGSCDGFCAAALDVLSSSGCQVGKYCSLDVYHELNSSELQRIPNASTMVLREPPRGPNARLS